MDAKKQYFGLFKKTVAVISAVFITIVDTFTHHVYSEPFTSEVINGQIVSGDTFDLSGIKLDVFLSEMAYSEKDVFIYSNKYQFSVFTDENGNYSFNKPSEKYLICVDLSSLPPKTGVDKNSIFVESEEDISTIELSNIANVMVENDSAIIQNIDNEDIISNVDVDKISEYDSVRDEIIETTTINANGFIQTSDVHKDMSALATLEKADILYNAGVISEEYKVEMYLDAYKKNDFDGQDCLTSIDDYLLNYYISHVGSDISQKVQSVFTNSNRSALSPYTFSSPGEKSITIGTGDTAITYKIHYENDATEACYMSNPSVVLGYVANIASYYYTQNQFNIPAYENGETVYHIYFYPMDGGVNGRCSSRSSGGSYISINYPPSSNTVNDLKKTIAHEMFHSIQLVYNNNQTFGNWFTEASATYAGLNYINTYLTYAKTKADNYLTTTSMRLNDYSSSNQRNYGEFLFPQYISQRYGGISAIRRVLEYYGTYGLYNSLAYATNSVAYDELFAGFSSYNADTRKYNNYTDGTNRYSDATRVGTNQNYSSSGSILSTAARFYDYIATTSSSNKLTLTINLTSGNYSSARFRIIKFPGDNSSSTLISTYTPTASSITIVSYNFKTGTTSSVFPKITLCAANVDTTTSSYVFSLSRTVE